MASPRRVLRLLAGVIAAALSVPVPIATAQDQHAWTAFPQPDPPSVQVSKTATDGRTVFLGGCNKLLGAGFTGSFSNYDGNALQRIDDHSENISLEIAGHDGAQSFPGKVRYVAPDRSWTLSELLPAAFVDAFARGDTLTIRNDEGLEVISFGLKGSSKAARSMRQVCGFSSAPADLPMDTWHAMSTTATAITGDIRVSAAEIRFQNGAKLKLAVTDHPGVLRVAEAANPVLNNDNLLCGQAPPTFVVFGRDEGTESLDGSSVLYLKVYNAKQLPPASDAIGMNSSGAGFCALYNYTR